MTGRSKPHAQRDLFRPLLSDFIDMKHDLLLLGNRIDRKYSEESFAPLYSHTGWPSMPIQLMLSSLMLKRICNLGYKALSKARVHDPYMQYFSGEA